jgi:hypothetical protein
MLALDRFVGRVTMGGFGSRGVDPQQRVEKHRGPSVGGACIGGRGRSLMGVPGPRRGPVPRTSRGCA